MENFAIDPAFKKLMAEIREETARADERERLKMLDETAHSRSNAMDPEEARRKAIEAEMASKRKEAARAMAQQPQASGRRR